MSRFQAVRALKRAVPAMALACGLALASQGQAAPIYLGSDTYSTANTALLTGPVNINVYLAPQVYKANFGTAASATTFDQLVFCVDIYHWSSSNLAYDSDLPLQSNSGTGGNFDALDSSQLDQIGYLVNYGTKLFTLDAVANVNKLAAVQGAIWKVANRDQGLSVDASNNSVDAMITTLSGAGYLAAIHGDVGSVSKSVQFLKETANYGQAGSHQAFAIAGPGAVPEPGAWGLMIVGFGLTGAMLRRRQMVLVRAS